VAGSDRWPFGVFLAFPLEKEKEKKEKTGPRKKKI